MLLPENLLNSHQVETDRSPTGASASVTMEPTYILAQPVICGGPSDVEPADEEIQQYCNEVKNEVEAQTNQKYVEFKAIKYRSNVACGTGFVIEVQVNECDYIHLHLLKQLPCHGGNIVFCSVEENHKKDDPL